VLFLESQKRHAVAGYETMGKSMIQPEATMKTDPRLGQRWLQRFVSARVKRPALTVLAVFPTVALMIACEPSDKVAGVAAGQANEKGDEMVKDAKGSYALVNGLNMYYEVHGTGEPLVLLHGAYTTIDTSFGQLLPALAQSRQVIAIEQQGHGHTEDIDRPLSFQQMADDTAGLLRQLNIEKADILGYSMGGTIAVEMGIRHPELVRKLVIISSPYKRDGWHSEVHTTIEQVTPEMFTGSGLPEAYAEVAPNPDGWATLVQKLKTLDLEYVGRNSEEFQSIKAPTLIILGDSDGVRLESALEMFTLLGGGVFGDVAGLPHSQLAVIPGSTHVGVIQKTDLLVPMITAFLNAPIPEARDPR
jgi:pimeloyl-ACP methyl ester carboxylesterase